MSANSSQTTPTFTGSCEINGTQFWISAWTKDGKPGGKMEGKRFFSLSFKPKDQSAGQPSAKPVPAPAQLAQSAPSKETENLDEDVPF